jgi:isocitrate dehydrogenase
VADKDDNPRAAVLATTLDAATGRLLDEGRSPSRKVGELDNRGSHFYLALYWAQALAEQGQDTELAREFRPLAERLAADEETIVEELGSVQGGPVDLGGYYRPDPERMDAVMRPSATFNDAIASLARESAARS